MSDIEASLSTLLATPHLLDETRFPERAAALDRLEVEIVDPLRVRLSGDALEHSRVRGILDRAEAFRHKLEQVDQALFRRLRQGVRGGLRGAELGNILARYADRTPVTASRVGYDELDDFIAGLLLPPPVPEASRPLEPGMVFYQPTPGRIILEMIDRAGAGEGQCFIDIGSGLGLVPMLVHLLTGASTIGIEVDPAYHRYAERRALDLGIADRVEFRKMDAREADYGQADIIFLYTPFLEGMLEDVLAKLRERRRREVRIFSYGPCTPILARHAWLRSVGNGVDPETLAEFQSKTRG